LKVLPFAEETGTTKGKGAIQYKRKGRKGGGATVPPLPWVPSASKQGGKPLAAQRERENKECKISELIKETAKEGETQWSRN